jgi:hypothetical protein
MRDNAESGEHYGFGGGELKRFISFLNTPYYKYLFFHGFHQLCT